MNKKSIIYLVVIAILLVIVFALFDKCSRTIFKEDSIKNENISTTKNKEIFEYNLDEKPINYKVDTKKGREEYFEYLKQYISNKYQSFEIISDIGSSINYNKKGLQTESKNLSKNKKSQIPKKPKTKSKKNSLIIPKL